MGRITRNDKMLRLVWIVAGSVIAVFFVLQISRSNSVHAESITYDNFGSQLAVECVLVNPTSKSVSCIASLRMVGGHQSKTSNPTAYPPIEKSLELAAGESRTIRFETTQPVNQVALRSRVNVRVLATH